MAVDNPENVDISDQPVDHVDSLALSITRDGSWELFDGQRIYQKEVIKDDAIPGHTILKIRTFQKDSQVLMPERTINLFDNAESCIEYYNQSLKDSKYYNEISQITSKYDDRLKTFVPVIHDVYGDTYEELFLFGFLTKGPASKQRK